MQKPLNSEVSSATGSLSSASPNMWYQISQPSLSMDDVTRNSNVGSYRMRLQLSNNKHMHRIQRFKSAFSLNTTWTYLGAHRGNTSSNELRVPPNCAPLGILPFLTMCSELATGSCMAAFKWNGGGKWKSKEWTSELPTDSQVQPVFPLCLHSRFATPDCYSSLLRVHGHSASAFTKRQALYLTVLCRFSGYSRY